MIWEIVFILSEELLVFGVALFWQGKIAWLARIEETILLVVEDFLLQ